MTEQVLQSDLDRWLNAGAWFISEVNYVLDHLYPEVSENGWGIIPKEENPSQHKYDQA